MQPELAARSSRFELSFGVIWSDLPYNRVGRPFFRTVELELSSVDRLVSTAKKTRIQGMDLQSKHAELMFASGLSKRLT